MLVSGEEAVQVVGDVYAAPLEPARVLENPDLVVLVLRLLQNVAVLVLPHVAAQQNVALRHELRRREIVDALAVKPRHEVVQHDLVVDREHPLQERGDLRLPRLVDLEREDQVDLLVLTSSAIIVGRGCERSNASSVIAFYRNA